MLQALEGFIMSGDVGCEIIPFPARAHEPDEVRRAVWGLQRHELLTAADGLLFSAGEAADRGDDEDFFGRIRDSYLCLERIMAEWNSH